jgi:hypothetical protein
MQLDSDLSASKGIKHVRIKKFNVVQSSLTYATVAAILVGIIIIPIALFGSIFGNLFSDMPGMTMGGGIMMMVLAPVLYFAITFVLSLIGFSIYNLASNWTGGFEVEVEA